MAVIIDGTSGVSTPGVTDTGNLSVAGSTTLTTPLPVASGGTGATSLSGVAVGNLAGGSAGTIPYQSSVGTTAMLATGTSGQLLQSNGALAAPSWVTLVAGTNIARSTKTANYTLASADKGNLVVATSGTFTFAFTAAATLGSGWCVYLQNSGTGNITLDPNASETIDGLTSYIMYPGEVRLVQCDGTSFYSIVLSGFYTTFLSTGTFTKPPGYQQFAGYLWGAGGGGGKIGSVSLNYGVGAGGGGACTPFTYPASLLSATETVTIGAGGNGATAGYQSAGAGGYSQFKSIKAYGGGGGWGDTSGNSQYGGGGGGSLSAGTTATAGGPFYGGSPATTGQYAANNAFGGGAGYGGGGQSNSVYGGSGGGGNGASGDTMWGGVGGQAGYAQSGSFNLGTSIFGGAGGTFSISGTAGNGSVPGGGGGATATGTAGSGGNGQLIIWGIV